MSVFEQLKRRNVIRVAALYVVVSWLILQVADVMVDAFELPNWGMRLLISILLLGFPLALAFSNSRPKESYASPRYQKALTDDIRVEN